MAWRGGYSGYDGQCNEWLPDARPPTMRTIGRGVRCRACLAPAAVLVVLALAACGNEVTPTSGASSTTPSAGSAMPRDVVGTQIPAGPATAAFLERARAVEQAVRAA